MSRGTPPDPEAAWARIQQSERRQLLTPSLLLLTCATGVVDAVSYLAVGAVFTANMTGNLVLIGFAVGGQPGFSIPRTVVALLGFMAGAALAGRLAAAWHVRPFIWMQRVTRIELAVLVVAAGIGATLTAGVSTPDSAARFAVVILLSMAMGMRNSTVRRLGFPDVPTTVATSTISDLASESRWGGGEQRNQGERVVAIAAMLLGAAAGAALIRGVDPVAGYALAVIAVLAAVLHHTVLDRRYPAPHSADPHRPQN